MKKIIFSTLFVISLFSTLAVSESTWRINQDHSSLFFKVPYLSLSSVTGRFTKFTGRLKFRSGSNIPQKLSLKIHAKSLFTGNKIRDGHLSSNDFFMVDKYEFITYKSTSLKKIKDNRYEVQGVLQIKETKKSVSFIINITETVSDSWGFDNKFVTFKTKFNRQDFNINWNKSLKDSKYLVGDIVDVWGKFQIQPLNTQTPSHKFMIPNTKYTTLKDKLTRGDIEQAEFDKEVEGFKTNAAAKKSIAPDVIKTKKNLVVEKQVVNKVSQALPNVGKSTLWWISYYIMGFIGFLATLIVCLQGKFFFMNLWPKKYNEVGILGIGSDLIAYAIAFIYVWAMWNITYN